MHADVKTFSKTGSVTGLDDWPIGEGRLREYTRYACPEDVFEHEYGRPWGAKKQVAGYYSATPRLREAWSRGVVGRFHRLAILGIRLLSSVC